MDSGSTKVSFATNIPVKDFLHLDIFPTPIKKYIYVDGTRPIGDDVPILTKVSGVKIQCVLNLFSSTATQENFHSEKECAVSHPSIFKFYTLIK